MEDNFKSKKQKKNQSVAKAKDDTKHISTGDDMELATATATNTNDDELLLYTIDDIPLELWVDILLR